MPINRICSGFSKEACHPKFVQGILLCFAIVALGNQLFRECDAAADLRGSLSSSDVSKVISFKCWFSLGAVKAYSIQQTRKLLHDTNGEVQILSITPRSHLNDPSPLNLMKENVSVEGSLLDGGCGVTLTIHHATCQDTGEYICEFMYQTVQEGALVDRVTAESVHLNMYPDILSCTASPAMVDFSRLIYNKVFLRISCQIRSTVELSWSWESKPPTDTGEWQTISSKYLSYNVPEAHERCLQSWGSTMFYQVFPGDENRHFRVYVNYNGGRSRTSALTLKDKSDFNDEPGVVDYMWDFQTMLTISGWILLSMVFFIIVMLVVNVAYPRLSNIGNTAMVMHLMSFRHSGIGLLHRIHGRLQTGIRQQRRLPDSVADTQRPQSGEDHMDTSASRLGRPENAVDGEQNNRWHSSHGGISIEDMDIVGAEDWTEEGVLSHVGSAGASGTNVRRSRRGSHSQESRRGLRDSPEWRTTAAVPSSPSPAPGPTSEEPSSPSLAPGTTSEEPSSPSLAPGTISEEPSSPSPATAEPSFPRPARAASAAISRGSSAAQTANTQ